MLILWKSKKMLFHLLLFLFFSLLSIKSQLHETLLSWHYLDTNNNTQIYDPCVFCCAINNIRFICRLEGLCVCVHCSLQKQLSKWHVVFWCLCVIFRLRFDKISKMDHLNYNGLLCFRPNWTIHGIYWNDWILI